MDHSKTLKDMSRETRTSGWSYVWGLDRETRSLMLPIRVTPTEREAIRAAAESENKSVAAFIRAAIAVRARDGFCKREEEEQSVTAGAG